ncbi:MAG: hypothetical protein ACXW4E_02260 [Anaerolineales bacterium]
MIPTLLVTIITESTVAFGYSIWRKKPVPPLLLTSVCINLITQSFLWIGLNLYFRHYLLTLIIAEFLIWMVESVLLYSVSANRLRLTDATLLSLTMNLASLLLGWFLPT